MLELNAFHVVLTTHNSRVSQRMREFKIQSGPPIKLSLLEEIELTAIIADIIEKGEIRCMAYNICCDHVHLIIVTEESQLSGIVRTIKSNSSRLFHRLKIPFSHNAEDHKNHLWSQKFFYADMDIWTVGGISKKPGYIFGSSYLENALVYINTNRSKHKLPESGALQRIIKSFVMTQEEAFKIN